MRFPSSSVQIVAFALTAPLVVGFSLLPSPILPSSGVTGTVRSLPEPLIGGVPVAPVMARRMVATNAEAEAVAAAEAEAEMGQKRKKTKEVRTRIFIICFVLSVGFAQASSSS